MTAPGYRFHPAAREELDQAGEWYDEQLPGLSLELFDAVEDAIDLIVERPLAWQLSDVVAGREIRRFVMRRFPFSVVYFVEAGVVIVAVALEAEARLLGSPAAAHALSTGPAPPLAEPDDRPTWDPRRVQRLPNRGGRPSCQEQIAERS